MTRYRADAHRYELIRVEVHLLTGGSPCVIVSGVWLIELR